MYLIVLGLRFIKVVIKASSRECVLAVLIVAQEELQGFCNQTGNAKEAMLRPECKEAHKYKKGSLLHPSLKFLLL